MISLKPSATDCNKPKIPITLGPRRRCTEPKTLRSTKTKKATVINNRSNKLKLPH